MQQVHHEVDAIVNATGFDLQKSARCFFIMQWVHLMLDAIVYVTEYDLQKSGSFGFIIW